MNSLAGDVALNSREVREAKGRLEKFRRGFHLSMGSFLNLCLSPTGRRSRTSAHLWLNM